MESLSIVFTGKDQVEVVREQVREPGPGEVLVKAEKTLISTGTEGICLSRLFEPGTHWDNWVKYPFYPGYSLAGRVAALGPDVKDFREGERVAARANHRQYAALSQGSLYRIPAGVSDEDATWFGLANIVQNGVRRAEHALGDAVAVVGLGLLGQLVVQYARLLGARAVVAVDPAEKRLGMAHRHGATAMLPCGAAEARDEILKLTDGGPEVVYDVTGHAAVFPACLAVARRFGRVIVLGDTGAPARQCLTSDVITRGLRIIGAHDNNPPHTSTDHAYWSHPKMADLFFTYLARGDMNVSDLVTHRYSPTEAAEAYRMLRDDRASAMGVLFDWTAL